MKARKRRRSTPSPAKLPPPIVSLGCVSQDYDMSNHIHIGGGNFRMKSAKVDSLRLEKERAKYQPIKQTTPKTTPKGKTMNSSTKPRRRRRRKTTEKPTTQKKAEKKEYDSLSMKSRVIELMQLESFTDQEICDQLSEEFPEATKVSASVSWHRWDHNKKNPEDKLKQFKRDNSGNLYEYNRAAKSESVPSHKATSSTVKKKPGKKKAVRRTETQTTTKRPKKSDRNNSKNNESVQVKKSPTGESQNGTPQTNRQQRKPKMATLKQTTLKVEKKTAKVEKLSEALKVEKDILKGLKTDLKEAKAADREAKKAAKAKG